MPTGYPKTDPGKKMRTLKQFFTPLEAYIATHMSNIPNSSLEMFPQFKKKGFFKNLEEFSYALDVMHKKGTLNCRNSQRKKYYSVNTFF